MNPTELFNNCLYADDAMLAARELLMTDPDELDETIADLLDRFPSLRRIDLEQQRDALLAMQREPLTSLLLEHSLCPLHRIDYAICFDDDDDECAAIRLIHPDHDT